MLEVLDAHRFLQNSGGAALLGLAADFFRAIRADDDDRNRREIAPDGIDNVKTFVTERTRQPQVGDDVGDDVIVEDHAGGFDVAADDDVAARAD